MRSCLMGRVEGETELGDLSDAGRLEPTIKTGRGGVLGPGSSPPELSPSSMTTMSSSDSGDRRNNGADGVLGRVAVAAVQLVTQLVALLMVLLVASVD